MSGKLRFVLVEVLLEILLYLEFFKAVGSSVQLGQFGRLQVHKRAGFTTEQGGMESWGRGMRYVPKPKLIA